MGKVDYSKMTFDELLQAEADVARQRDDLSETHKTIRALIDSKKAEADAIAKIAGLNDKELEALAQVLKAKGIESGEAFGSLGM